MLMNEAIWYVISDLAYVIWGAVLAYYFIVALLHLILGGFRSEWWRTYRGGDSGRTMK